jgi:hypothetical protein
MLQAFRSATGVGPVVETAIQTPRLTCVPAVVNAEVLVTLAVVIAGLMAGGFVSWSDSGRHERNGRTEGQNRRQDKA